MIRKIPVLPKGFPLEHRRPGKRVQTMKYATFVTFGPDHHDIEICFERSGGLLGLGTAGSGHSSGHTHAEEADEEIQRETANIVS